MKTKIISLIPVLLVLMLSGCVIYVDESGDADFNLGTAKVKADQTLADRVAGEMQDDDLLSHEDIKIKARSGIVILEGRVDNATVIDRAIKVAANTEGVDTVKSRLEIVVDR